MAHQFLAKTQISLSNCLKVGDELALEKHQELQALLADRIGGQAAALFAEPLLSRGNDTAPASVSWYADIEGKPRALSALPPSAREAVETYLADTLAPLRPLLADPSTADLVAAALWQNDAEDLLVVGGRPILVNWGMRPQRLGRNASMLSSHYAATLGRYLPLSSPPGVGTPGQVDPVEDKVASESMAIPSSAMPSPTPPRAAPAEEEPQQSLPPTPPAGDGVAAHRGIPTIAWAPLVLLLFLAIVTLIWLLWPGNRLFPSPQAAAAITTEDAKALAEQVNRDLRDRRDALRAALSGAQCRADGTLLLPDGRTPQGLLPPPLSGGNAQPATPGDRAALAPDGVLSPTPERVVVPDPFAAPGDGANAAELPVTGLLNLIEARTVLVLTSTDGSLGNGTGFVVGPGLIVTNQHVIEDAVNGGEIYIVNPQLSTPQAAEVIKSLGPLEETGGDFALLRIGDTSLPAFDIHLPQDTLKLTNVIAAGFPGDVLQTDSAFRALIRGDGTATPDLTVSDGLVTTEQDMSSRTRVLVHSASLSKGNSGGPLVDLCGRVIGVNTFVRRGDLRTLNFALAPPDLLAFLSDTQATPRVVSEVCAPQALRPTPTPNAEPAQAPDGDGAAD
ncbi:MAG: trypsin-like peptidase domain-containing protein [Pseudomonadota bacterium]